MVRDQLFMGIDPFKNVAFLGLRLAAVLFYMVLRFSFRLTKDGYEFVQSKYRHAHICSKINCL